MELDWRTKLSLEPGDIWGSGMIYGHVCFVGPRVVVIDGPELHYVN
jgi:hypothetical protein